MQTLQIPIPDDGIEAIRAVLKDGETVADFGRAGLNRELKARKSAAKISTAKRGRPSKAKTE